MKIIDLKQGLSFFTKSKNSQFLKELKRIFNLLEIQFNDPCCPGTSTTPPKAVYLILPQNDIPAATGGAISVTNYLTTVNTDADDDAFTLADGTVIGQMKKIQFVGDGGGDAVITAATALTSGDTIMTMDDATDFIILMWTGSAWAAIENSGTTLS